MLSVVTILIVIVIVNYLEPSTEEVTKNAYESLKYETFYGIVQEKFYDKKNHNHPPIILRNKFGKQYVLLVRDESGLFSYIESGDSISKPYGKYEVSLNRNGADTIFVLHY